MTNAREIAELAARLRRWADSTQALTRGTSGTLGGLDMASDRVVKLLELQQHPLAARAKKERAKFLSLPSKVDKEVAQAASHEEIEKAKRTLHDCRNRAHRLAETLEIIAADQPPETAASEDAPSHADAKPAGSRDAKQPARATLLPWSDAPNRSCFVFTNEGRFEFWHCGGRRDLRLGKKGRVYKLLSLFIDKDIVSQKNVKECVCTNKVTPFHAVRDINRQLNQKVEKLGFHPVPKNVAFVYFDSESSTYTMKPKVLPQKTADELWGLDS